MARDPGDISFAVRTHMPGPLDGQRSPWAGKKAERYLERDQVVNSRKTRAILDNSYIEGQEILFVLSVCNFEPSTASIVDPTESLLEGLWRSHRTSSLK